MDAAALIARMEEQRSTWVPLPGGQRVRLRRPNEVDFHRFVGGVGIEPIVEYANGWEGFTEATLLGDAVGASDAVPFDRGLWGVWVRDHIDAAKVCVDAMVKMVTDHLAAKDASAKN
jgi:hypothetical protein